jgi:Protein of unknown function (DUF1629)
MRVADKITGPPDGQSFWLVTNQARSRAAGRQFINQDEVCKDSGSVILSPPSTWDRGFRPYAVRPRFRISKRLGRMPPDVENYVSYWFISDAAKRFLDDFSPTDFVYLAIDVQVDPGCEPAIWWLCDIVNVLDAIDEEQSVGLRPIVGDTGRKVHNNVIWASTVFDESVVGKHNVFRPATSPDPIVCTGRFKDAFKKAGLTGQSFPPAFEPWIDKIGTVTMVVPAARMQGGGFRQWRGDVTLEDSGKVVGVLYGALDDEENPPNVGEKIRVRLSRLKWPSRPWSVTRATRIEAPAASG